MTDQEQIAALQAQLDAVRHRLSHDTDDPYDDAHVSDALTILASAPSDALDRVKREAAEKAWNEGFDAGQGSMLHAAGGTAKTNPYRTEGDR